jgi:hypothetical protein
VKPSAVVWSVVGTGLRARRRGGGEEEGTRVLLPAVFASSDPRALLPSPSPAAFCAFLFVSRVSQRGRWGSETLEVVVVGRICVQVCRAYVSCDCSLTVSVPPPTSTHASHLHPHTHLFLSRTHLGTTPSCPTLAACRTGSRDEATRLTAEANPWLHAAAFTAPSPTHNSSYTRACTHLHTVLACAHKAHRASLRDNRTLLPVNHTTRCAQNLPHASFLCAAHNLPHTRRAITLYALLFPHVRTRCHACSRFCWRVCRAGALC